MSEVTQILQAVERGDKQAASELLPLVYDELRKLAAQKLAQEKPGQTLQPTALVHEAYLRLVGPANADGFANRRHFFVAAAEAMRRILVDRAREKNNLKQGGHLQRISAEKADFPFDSPLDPTELLAIHEALDLLATASPRKAEVVKMRFYLGMNLPEIAEILDTAQATIERDWTFARTWLFALLQDSAEKRTNQ